VGQAEAVDRRAEHARANPPRRPPHPSAGVGLRPPSSGPASPLKHRYSVGLRPLASGQPESWPSRRYLRRVGRDGYPLMDGTFWSAHDPGDLPWLVAAGYLLASCMAVWAASRTTVRSERWFWWIATAGLLFLAVNKQLDLQTLLTDVVRGVATRGGWFEQRRAAQAAFITGVALLALVMAAFLAWLALKSRSGVKLAFLGLTLLGAYILVRGALFNHFDAPLGGIPSAVRDNNYLELGCILVVIAGQLRAVFAR